MPPPRGLRTGKLGKMYAAMIYIGRMRVRINPPPPQLLPSGTLHPPARRPQNLRATLAAPRELAVGAPASYPPLPRLSTPGGCRTLFGVQSGTSVDCGRRSPACYQSPHLVFCSCCATLVELWSRVGDRCRWTHGARCRGGNGAVFPVARTHFVGRLRALPWLTANGLRPGLDRCHTVLWSCSGEPYVTVPPSGGLGGGCTSAEELGAIVSYS